MSDEAPRQPIPIDPLADCVFKALFGTESNKDILMDFLNAVLGAIGLPLAASVDLVPPRHLREHAETKETEVDVRAVDADGRAFQIEVQLESGGPLAQRMIFGAGRLHNSTLIKGRDYDQIKPAVSIWILRDRLPRRTPGFRSVSVYRYREADGETLDDYPTIVVIELKNWKEKDILVGEIERWLFFFKHGRELSLYEELPPELRSEVFMKAVKETKSFNDELFKRMAYDSYMDKVLWNRTMERRRREEDERRKAEDAERARLDAERAREDERRQAEDAERAREDERRKAEDAERARLDAERAREDGRLREEDARLAKGFEEIEARQAEIRRKLLLAYRALIDAGKTPEESAALLGTDIEALDPPPALGGT